MDIIWVFTETCACKKHFKIQSTRGTTYSWFLTTGGDPDPCPTTTTGGSFGGGFTSNFSSTYPCATMLCKINRQKQSYFTVLNCIHRV